ncbi:helix-turn-helix transcriptional regulator [Streptomyces sp. NPDC055239]
MTTTTQTTSLPPAQQRVAQHLVDGLTPRNIAAGTGVTIGTVRQYIGNIRTTLNCPPRCTMPVLMHCLCTGKEVELPPTNRPVPELIPEQKRLLRAVAEHSRPRDIALAAEIAPADLRSAINKLLAKTGTTDTTQLVVLAHTWGLLGAGPTSTVHSGASQ